MSHLPKRISVNTRVSGFGCRKCYLARRQFASSSQTTPVVVPPKPPTSGLARLSNRRLLKVDGTDAVKFLQGLITGNILAKGGLPRLDAFYTGFLNATGRVMHDVFVYPVQDSTGQPTFYVEADASQIDVLAKYIKKHKLRAKVNLRKIEPESANIWQAWDEPNVESIGPGASDSAVIVPDPRVPGLGYRVLQFNDKKPALDLDESTQDAYTVRRYLHGVPEGQDEILREQALPLEINMEHMNAIDFNKGCYVGQELTIRTKHRGVVRKRILPVMIYGRDKATPQTLQYDPETVLSSLESIQAEMIPGETSIGRFEKKGRSAGKWIKGVGNIGLGLCRLEIMTDVVLPGEQASSNFKDGDEFALQWGEEKESMIKVKAFIPEWLKAGLAKTK